MQNSYRSVRGQIYIWFLFPAAYLIGHGDFIVNLFYFRVDPAKCRAAPGEFRIDPEDLFANPAYLRIDPASCREYPERCRMILEYAGVTLNSRDYACIVQGTHRNTQGCSCSVQGTLTNHQGSRKSVQGRSYCFSNRPCFIQD